jgi:hypothetical protein
MSHKKRALTGSFFMRWSFAKGKTPWTFALGGVEPERACNNAKAKPCQGNGGAWKRRERGG